MIGRSNALVILCDFSRRKSMPKMGVQLYWVSFSKTDNQEFNTWESTCTGFHFPKRTNKKQNRESTCTGFNFLVSIFFFNFTQII